MTASQKKLDEYKTMFLESEIRDLQKLLKEERDQNQMLSEKLQLTERQLAVERLCVYLIIVTVSRRGLLWLRHWTFDLRGHGFNSC